MKRVIITYSLIIFSFISFGQQMEFQVDGNISFDNSGYSISEAGEDYLASIENQSSVYFSVLYTSFWDRLFNSNSKWSIHVNKTDVLWDNNLMLEIRRTGNGSNIWGRNVNIHDGTRFQVISNTPTYFIRGLREVYNIPISFKISGASVTMGAKQFETNVVITVTDSW